MSGLTEIETIRKEAGFFILYEEGPWIVGYYRSRTRDPGLWLHIYNKRAWGSLSPNEVTESLKDQFFFWRHMLDL